MTAHDGEDKSQDPEHTLERGLTTALGGLDLGVKCVHRLSEFFRSGFFCGIIGCFPSRDNILFGYGRKSTRNKGPNGRHAGLSVLIDLARVLSRGMLARAGGLDLRGRHCLVMGGRRHERLLVILFVKMVLNTRWC